MNKNKKVFGNAHIRNTFCSEVIIRVLANALLLAFHIRTWLLRQKSNLTDLPIGLLALIHLLMLLIVGSITPDLFTSQGRSWDDITCKSLVYLHRVMRGLSVCTTSLLSVLQAVTLSPRSSCLAKLKHRSSRHHLCCLLLLWLFYTSVSSHLCISIFAIPNQTSANFMYVTASCTIAPLGYLLRHVLSTLLIFRDSFLMGLMAISGGYMVVLLFRHKRQSQSLHCTKLALRASPEQKATRTILLLLSFFLFMSTLNCFASYARTLLNDNPIIYCIHIFMAHSYATLCPIVFISTGKSIINFLRSKCRRQVCGFQ